MSEQITQGWRRENGMEIYISNNPSSWKQYGFLAKLSLECFPAISCECSIFQWLSGMGQKEATCRSEQKGICEGMKRGLDFWDGAISLKNYNPDKFFFSQECWLVLWFVLCVLRQLQLFICICQTVVHCKVLYFGSQDKHFKVSEM